MVFSDTFNNISVISRRSVLLVIVEDIHMYYLFTMVVMLEKFKYFSDNLKFLPGYQNSEFSAKY
jgi:hypothetical protein